MYILTSNILNYSSNTTQVYLHRILTFYVNILESCLTNNSVYYFRQHSCYGSQNSLIEILTGLEAKLSKNREVQLASYSKCRKKFSLVEKMAGT